MIVDDYKDEDGLWVKTVGAWPNRLETRSCKTYDNMVSRCKVGGKYQSDWPTYVGCFMSENFKDFQYFAEWSHKQVGFNMGYFLDKDLLFKGNKEYSEKTCIFVPHQLNTFFLHSSDYKKQGQYLPGCYFNVTQGKFKAQINVNNVRTTLGTFKTELEAHLKWKEEKERQAYCWYEKAILGEVILDPRIIEKMRVWKHSV